MMWLSFLPDGTKVETYPSEIEYRLALGKAQLEMGRRQIIYHGWLNGKLVIMYRS